MTTLDQATRRATEYAFPANVAHFGAAEPLRNMIAFIDRPDHWFLGLVRREYLKTEAAQ